MSRGETAGVAVVPVNPAAVRHLDHEAAEVQVGSVGDVEPRVVGVLAFVLQPHVHHQPLPVALNDT